MLWIIPMAGRGMRTKPLGEFKPFIEIKGHKILSWFIASVKSQVKRTDTFLFITTEYFYDKFDFREQVDNLFKKHGLKNEKNYLTTLATPQGTSDTLLKAEKLVSVDEPVMVINPDQYIDLDLPQKIKKRTGYLGLYLCFGTDTGFVEVYNGLIIRFVERTNISNIASSGVFIVSSGMDLIHAIKQQMTLEETINGEYFLGPCFNYLIRGGYKIHPIQVRCKYDLGDFESIEKFKKTSIVCS